MAEPRPFPCRFCQHALTAHNLKDGCTNFTCLATPGEATPQTTEEQDLPILGPGEALPRYIRPFSARPEPEVLAVKEAERRERAETPGDSIRYAGYVVEEMLDDERRSLAEAQRVDAIEQADAYLSTHRKSEVWSLINRLRDELVRAGRKD